MAGYQLTQKQKLFSNESYGRQDLISETPIFLALKIKILWQGINLQKTRSCFKMTVTVARMA